MYLLSDDNGDLLTARQVDFLMGGIAAAVSVC